LLSAAQQYTVFMLVQELDRLNHALETAKAAVNDLARRYAADVGCKGGGVQFVKTAEGQISLQITPAPLEEEGTWTGSDG
ncbi:MAG: hypothetical protein ABT940_13800, partial [Alphaproteobacteria bacterium]